MKVLIVLTSHALLGTTGTPTGYYLPEVSHPYFELVEHGIDVDIASIKGGEAPVDPKSVKLDDPKNKAMWEDKKHRTKLRETLTLDSINPRDYQGVLFAGGHGTMWDFRGNPAVQKTIREIYEAGGSVAAVCHGPAALVDVKLSNGSYLVKGRKITGFTNAEEEAVELTKVMPFLLEDQLKANGGIFENSGLWEKKVVVDGRIITGQNPASAEGVGQELVKVLKKASI